MATDETGTEKTKTYVESKQLLDDAWQRALKLHKEAKQDADAVYAAAKKAAPDKEARKRVDQAHDEALKEATRLRDAITTLAQTAFTDSFRQRDLEAKDAVAKSKERVDLAQKTYSEAKVQMDKDHREAKTQAVDSEGRKSADAAHKEAEKRAKEQLGEALKQ
jgi:hypothetical protein